jgi:hypothetical protein
MLPSVTAAAPGETETVVSWVVMSLSSRIEAMELGTALENNWKLARVAKKLTPICHLLSVGIS